MLIYFSDAKKLNDVAKVTVARDFVCLALSQYCKVNSVHDPSRFAKLLMRLPSMRSWSLKGVENLLFTKAAFDFDDTIVKMILDRTL